MPVGRTNPSVINDDPLVISASLIGSMPVPQKIAVNPRTIDTTHTAGSVTSASGAYIAMIRSRVAKGRLGFANTWNRRRSVRKWSRVSVDVVARGSTTVCTAETSVQSTRTAPAIRTATRTTITAAP